MHLYLCPGPSVCVCVLGGGRGNTFMCIFDGFTIAILIALYLSYSITFCPIYSIEYRMLSEINKLLY